jgi:[protein-PII] uridylyltransferase
MAFGQSVQMTSTSDSREPETPAQRIQRRKAKLVKIRDRARKLFGEGALGTQIASMISEAMDEYVCSIMDETLAELPDAKRQLILQNSAMIAVGGSGRGEVAPHSDADLLFVYKPHIAGLYSEFSRRTVAEFWDAGVKLGQRVFTVSEAIRQSRDDPHLNTSMVHIRHLWGEGSLTGQLTHRFQRGMVRRRVNSFLEDCISGREQERAEKGALGQQLEPDVKCSQGGLRDVHLIQWIGYAHYETSSIDGLRRKDALSRDDAKRLQAATEFLTRVRIDLHLHANRPNDLLTKDEQLRIAETRLIEPTDAQSAVELFMQDYFTHSMAVVDIAKRFVGRHRPVRIGKMVRDLIIARRINKYFVLTPDELDVRNSHIPKVCRNLDDLVGIFHTASMYRVGLSPRLMDAIKRKAQELTPGPSLEVSRMFMEILKSIGCLAKTLRAMHESNVLELIIPEWKHVRCLLQFNQYHHYTVDEHTLQCLEICESFADEDSPKGAAYRNDIQARSLLHLALLLHDAGKGMNEDHSEVGRRLAIDVCQRLRLTEYQAEVVSFLIHKHLVMADLAFRQDTSDPKILLKFSHEVGTPEKLSMLYVLTAADVSGVGPGTWNHWKADLLADFYDRLMMIVSGQHSKFHENERLELIRSHVYQAIVPLESKEEEHALQRWVDSQLKSFSSHYLTMTDPSQIAVDLDMIRGLHDREVRITARFDPESETVDYRIITGPENRSGCFHLITGVLTAKNMEILGAEIATSTEGFVVDVFHVLDGDYSGDVPQIRIDEVTTDLYEVLNGEVSVEELFKRHRRFAPNSSKEIVMELPLQVKIDNDTSNRSTVVSVFAHDQHGLLYSISKTIFQLGLSIELAKISTHFDQVVDVFYVVDASGEKINNAAHYRVIEEQLMATLKQLEDSAD